MSRGTNFLLFYAGWFACVLGAARGVAWAGPVVATAVLALHLASAPNRLREARFIAIAGAFGFAVDTALASAGLFSFAGASLSRAVSPPWMVALWMLFATTLGSSMAWIGGRPALAACLGAVFGPLSYAAGARLGAITVTSESMLPFAGIAVAWAATMPALMRLRSHTAGPARSLREHASLARLAGLVVAAIVLTAPASARATSNGEIEGVRFEPAYERDGVSLGLRCTGLLRYRVLFKGYVAALYLPSETPAARVLDDVPKRLELGYFWAIAAADIASTGDRILARNIDAKTYASLRSALDQINALYEDVKPGDRYALTYVPGRGTELSLNGVSKGVVPGAEFARAYFRIWLGNDPIDESLRDQLLSCGSGA